MRRVRREPESAPWKTVKLALGVVAAIASLALAWLALRDDDAPPPAKPAAVARQSPMHASAAPASAGSAASPRSASTVTHVVDDPRCVIAMVDLLEHRSDTLMARGVGTSIDRRLTGNVEPGKQLSVQRGHLLALQLASTSSCDDLRAKLSIIRRLGVDGEVAVAQDLAR